MTLYLFFEEREQRMTILKPKYKLQNLKESEEFIAQNGHPEASSGQAMRRRSGRKWS
jgi:hypothetical protein